MRVLQSACMSAEMPECGIDGAAVRRLIGKKVGHADAPGCVCLPHILTRLCPRAEAAFQPTHFPSSPPSSRARSSSSRVVRSRSEFSSSTHSG